MTRIWTVFAFATLLMSSCGSDEATLYCATDQRDAEILISRFEKETGTAIRERYDTEASKTLGLVQAIIEERQKPRASVFWNNELIHTVRLKKLGLLEPYDSPSAKEIPEIFKDKDRMFTGFAARARILIINTEKMPDANARPKSMWDLCDPRFKGKGAMARPLTGTTLTHAAALFATLGEKRTWDFFHGLKKNEVTMTGGNAQVMRMVSSSDPGTPAFGFTDTDDFRKAQIKGRPVIAVYPDQDGIGTMVIPNTVCLIKGGPKMADAKKLIDYLLSKRTEESLAAGASAQIPVRKSVKRPEHVRSAENFKVLAWDPEKTADALDKYKAKLREYFGK